MNKYKYSVCENEEYFFSDAREFESMYSTTGEGPTFVAEDAAGHYHHWRGWERDWPIKFRIWNMDGSEVGTFSIDRESVPEFTATFVVV